MKILKSIWKSKEAPRDENFLWLKFEEGTFNLYTKGQTGWEIIKGVPVEQLQGYTLYSNQVFNLNNIPAKPADGNKYFILAAEGNIQNYSEQVSYAILTSDPEHNNGNWASVFRFYIKYGEFEDNIYPSNTIGYLASKGYVDEMVFTFASTGNFTEQEFEQIVNDDFRFNKNFPQSMGNFFGNLAYMATWHSPITFKMSNASSSTDTYLVTQKYYNDPQHWKLIASGLGKDGYMDLIIVKRNGNTYSVSHIPYNPTVILADSFSNFSLQTKANAASQLGITEDELDAIIEGRVTIKKGNYIMRVSKREIISQTNVICTYSSVSINIYSTTLDVESSFFYLSKEGDYYNAIYNSGTSTVAKS